MKDHPAADRVQHHGEREAAAAEVAAGEDQPAGEGQGERHPVPEHQVREREDEGARRHGRPLAAEQPPVAAEEQQPEDQLLRQRREQRIEREDRQPEPGRPPRQPERLPGHQPPDEDRRHRRRRRRHRRDHPPVDAPPPARQLAPGEPRRQRQQQQRHRRQPEEHRPQPVRRRRQRQQQRHAEIERRELDREPRLAAFRRPGPNPFRHRPSMCHPGSGVGRPEIKPPRPGVNHECARLCVAGRGLLNSAAGSYGVRGHGHSARVSRLRHAHHRARGRRHRDRRRRHRDRRRRLAHHLHRRLPATPTGYTGTLHGLRPDPRRHAASSRRPASTRSGRDRPRASSRTATTTASSPTRSPSDDRILGSGRADYLIGFGGDDRLAAAGATTSSSAASAATRSRAAPAPTSSPAAGRRPDGGRLRRRHLSRRRQAATGDRGRGRRRATPSSPASARASPTTSSGWC